MDVGVNTLLGGKTLRRKKHITIKAQNWGIYYLHPLNTKINLRNFGWI